MTKPENLEMKIYNLLTNFKVMFIQLIMMHTGNNRERCEAACRSLENRKFIKELENGIWEITHGH